MKKKPTKKNYKALISVIVLAIVFWFIVKMSQEYDYSFSIPLKITNNNEETCLKYPILENVHVEFSGRGIDLLRLNFYQPTYEVDLTGEKEKFVMNLSEHREYVNLPTKVPVSVKSIIRPHEIEFELDKRLEKKIPVQIISNVKTDNGFILVDTKPAPDSILVIGPAVYVDSLSLVFTEKKAYKKVSLAFVDHLKVLKNRQYYSHYFPEKIDVLFDVQRLAEKEIEDVRVKVINVPSNYEVVPLPSIVKIYVKGGEKILGEADSDDFEVVIDFKRDWRRGAGRVKARVNTDINISYVESRPALFELIVQKKRRASK